MEGVFVGFFFFFNYRIFYFLIEFRRVNFQNSFYFYYFFLGRSGDESINWSKFNFFLGLFFFSKSDDQSILICCGILHHFNLKFRPLNFQSWWPNTNIRLKIWILKINEIQLRRGRVSSNQKSRQNKAFFFPIFIFFIFFKKKFSTHQIIVGISLSHI